MQPTARDKTWLRRVCYVLIGGGLAGMAASFALVYDKIQVLKNVAYEPSCNFNPVLSCGSVMETEQASLFGVPNAVFGIAGYTALMTIGIMLLAGAAAKKWLWLMLQLGVTVAAVYSHYLFFQGVYRINAICPWCFVVWMATIPVFWYTTVYNLRMKNISLPGNIGRWLSKKAIKHHGDILLVWYLVIFAILLERFWYYWKTLL